MLRVPPSSSRDEARPDRDADERAPSKSQRKRDMTALQKLGQELVEQSAERLDGVDLPEDLRRAVDEARRIRDHEGRRRQMQYIGRLMRDVDAAPIRAALDRWAGTSRDEAAALHALERWRDRLLADDEALMAFAGEHGAALHPDHLQRLRQSIRMARKERVDGRPPKHFRELFRLIRELVESDSAGDEADRTGRPDRDRP